MPEKLPTKRFYTVKEVARLLGFSTNTVYKYLDEGKIKSTRLGKEGRFRVPAAEVVSLTQNKDIFVAQPVNQAPEMFSSESVVSAPSLFDWLCAMAAITIGFMQFAFPVGLTQNTVWFVTIGLVIARYLVMVFGVGIILSDIFSPVQKNRKIHKFFHIGTAILLAILALSFNLFAYPFLVLTYGALAIVMAVSFFIDIDEYFKFLILANLFAFFSGIILFLKPQDLGISAITAFISNGNIPFLILWLVGYVFFLTMSFIAVKKRGTWLFLIPIVVFVGSFLYGAASFYAGAWEKAINCIVVAAFAPIFPFYRNFESYTLKSKKDLTRAVFWIVGLFLIGGILIFFLRLFFEGSVISEMGKRTDAAAGIVDSFVEGDKSKVYSYSFDSGMVDAISSSGGDEEVQETLKRLFISSNGTFRAFTAIDASGKVVGRYPEVPGAIGIDISERDYFKAMRDGQKSYVSAVHQPRVPGTTPSIAITSPIMSTSGKFLGVLLGSVDLEELSNLLGDIKYGQAGQIYVVDSTNNYILNSDPVNVIQESNDPVSKLAISGQEGQIKKYSVDNILTFESYKPVFSGEWGVVLTDPYFDAMKNYTVTSLAVFLVVLVCGVGSLILVSYAKKKED